MKWLFIIFLLLNVCYFGWELDRQTYIEVKNLSRPLKIFADVPKLELLKELKHNSDAIDENSLEQENKTKDEHFDKINPLQNIVSMMEYGDVMIEKKVIDKLVSNLPDFSINNTKEFEAEKIFCISFGPFAKRKQADELSRWLEKRKIHTNQKAEDGKQNQMFWVYLSASESEEDAMAAIEDLKGKGVQDYQLIKKGNLQNSISLGLFSTQSAVNNRLNELKSIGYKPIVVPYHQDQSIIWVNVMGDTNDASMENVLSELINGYPSRFNSIPAKCEELFDTL